MDTEKISKFISTARTKIGLTQKELADKIGVSDKTISKWETGKSLPDISYYEPLCDALNIKVNELLSGEYLNDDIYLEKAENNFSKKKVVIRLLGGLSLFIATSILIGILSKSNFTDVFLGLYDLPTFIILLFINLGAVIISGKRTMDDILTLLRYISIPTGVLLTIVSLAMAATEISDITNLAAYLVVSLLATLYGIIEYIIVIILSRRFN